MQSRNLIPSYRLERRRRHRRVRAWGAAISVYAVLLAAVYVGCQALWGVDADAMARQREATRQRVRQIRDRIDGVQTRLAEAQRTLRANAALGDHPDWSLLLMLLARTMNEGVVLRQCSLTPAEPTAEAPAATKPSPGWRLEMSGYGKTVTAASEFALAMERTGLFQEVRLLKTVRQPFLAGQATHFQIHCALRRRAEETP